VVVELNIRNFKCFRQHAIPLRPTTVIVGRNNAGKSTIVEALRLVSLVVDRLGHLPMREVPRWLDIPIANRGVSPSLDNQNFDFENVFHRYGDPPATISARFDTGVEIAIYIGGPDRIHAVLKDSRSRVVISQAHAGKLGLTPVGILPQIGPLAKEETILVPQYVRQSISTRLASIHFRNELNLLYDVAFPEFKRISETTWHGLEVRELRGLGGERGEDLRLSIRNDDFVAEVGWMGHGLQMWLQTMWFLARCAQHQCVILDEPDVYMHADLQRKLIRFLNGRYPQVIVATHSVEIMSEVSPDCILVVDRERRQAQFTTDVPEVQKVVDQIGGIHNLQLARLWGSRRCLFVEGKDIGLLKILHDTLYSDSLDPIDAIPSMPLGGWSGWDYAVGSAMLLKKAVGGNIRSYCILDSDFHTQRQIAARMAQAQEKGVNLHIWERKEIENYLLVPTAIRRVLRRRLRVGVEPPSTEELTDKMFGLAGKLKHRVTDAIAGELWAENRAGGLAAANALARKRVYPRWHVPEMRLALVSGKEILASLSEWLQKNYGVSISAAAVAREINADELSDEVKAVLSAIEYGTDFDAPADR
jgi:hypothetical protein